MSVEPGDTGWHRCAHVLCKACTDLVTHGLAMQAARQLFCTAGSVYTYNWDNVNASNPVSNDNSVQPLLLFLPLARGRVSSCQAQP